MPLYDMLDNLTIPSGKSFKYFSEQLLQDLQFGRMDYHEKVLLIREEYVTTYNTLESWSGGISAGGGVVVTGQPGIGASRPYHSCDALVN
jgi:hypothetical protein